MVYAYTKSAQGDLTRKPATQSVVPEESMKDAAFQELITSVRQAGQIRRGTRRPSRSTTFHPTDVQAVRAKLGASQPEFALMIGVSVATLRNWEQGRRTPDGPALALLRVAARNPKAVIEALHTGKRARHESNGADARTLHAIARRGLFDYSVSVCDIPFGSPEAAEDVSPFAGFERAQE
jgi:putative transcriptional regulator